MAATTAITVRDLLLNRHYSPEVLEQSKAYRCMHTCKMSRELGEKRDNCLQQGEKLRLMFENTSERPTHLIILMVDSHKNVCSLFPSFSSEWSCMSFHHVPEGHHLVIQIDTDNLPIQKNSTSPQPFQIICCSVIKSIRQENVNNSISFSTNFEPVFQNFEFTLAPRN